MQHFATPPVHSHDRDYVRDAISDPPYKCAGCVWRDAYAAGVAAERARVEDWFEVGLLRGAPGSAGEVPPYRSTSGEPPALTAQELAEAEAWRMRP